jgi:hypothetical protein
MEKKFLWLGCNKRFVTLRSSQSKRVRFRLGFTSTGVFEVGQLSSETVMKMNLMDATSVTSFDDLIETSAAAAAAGGASPNGALNNSNVSASTLNETTSIISVYLRNKANENYELLKRLNPFTVCLIKK